MSKPSSLAKQAQDLHDIFDKHAPEKDENIDPDAVYKPITGRDILQGFLGKKVKIPRILQPQNVGKTELTNMEIILGRTELYLQDQSMSSNDFQKMIAFLFDKAFLNEDKKPEDETQKKNLSDISQENLLDTIIQIVKYLDSSNLELALNAVNKQLSLKGDSKIIVQQ